MGEMRVINEEAVPWTLGRRFVKDGVPRYVHNRFPIARLDPGPWFGRVRYDPGMRVERHQHPANEIIYILGGELLLGDQVCPPGTAITLQAGTTYGPLIAGPQGAEFLLTMNRDPSGRSAEAETETIPEG